MAEKEQSSRHRDKSWGKLNESFRIFGSVIVSLVLIVGAIYCALLGEPWLGAALGTSGVIVGIVRQFMQRGKK